MTEYSPEFYKLFFSVALLILVFLFKLFIGRSVGKSEAIQALIELPVSLFFLGLSLLVAVTISVKLDIMPFVCSIFGFIIVSVLLVFSWRECQKLYDSTTYKWLMVLFINLVIGFSGLYYSGSILMTSSKLKFTTEIKTSTPINPTSTPINPKKDSHVK